MWFIIFQLRGASLSPWMEDARARSARRAAARVSLYPAAMQPAKFLWPRSSWNQSRSLHKTERHWASGARAGTKAPGDIFNEIEERKERRGQSAYSEQLEKARCTSIKRATFKTSAEWRSSSLRRGSLRPRLLGSSHRAPASFPSSFRFHLHRAFLPRDPFALARFCLGENARGENKSRQSWVYEEGRPYRVFRPRIFSWTRRIS